MKKKIKETISLGEDRFMYVYENGQIIDIEVLLPKTTPEEAKKAIYVLKTQ